MRERCARELPGWAFGQVFLRHAVEVRAQETLAQLVAPCPSRGSARDALDESCALGRDAVEQTVIFGGKRGQGGSGLAAGCSYIAAHLRPDSVGWSWRHASSSWWRSVRCRVRVAHVVGTRTQLALGCDTRLYMRPAPQRLRQPLAPAVGGAAALRRHEVPASAAAIISVGATKARPDGAQGGLMSGLPDNPIGTDGFEFVEYTAPDPQLLRSLFERLGFPAVAHHRSKNVTLHRQGEINFIINAEPASFAQGFARAHGPSACAMAFRVHDSARAYSRALALGAKPGPSSAGPMELNIPCIEGIGGSLIYLVDLYGDRSIYDVDFRPVEGGTQSAALAGLTLIDHLTHNV